MTTLVAAVLLSIAGGGGLFLAILRLRGGNPPLPLALVHGTAAVAGVVALVIAVVFTPVTLLIAALVVAALGAPLGLMMLIKHRKQQLLPLALLFPHGLLEVSAIVLTWAAVLS